MANDVCRAEDLKVNMRILTGGERYTVMTVPRVSPAVGEVRVGLMTKGDKLIRNHVFPKGCKVTVVQDEGETWVPAGTRAAVRLVPGDRIQDDGTVYTVTGVGIGDRVNVSCTTESPAGPPWDQAVLTFRRDHEVCLLERAGGEARVPEWAGRLSEALSRADREAYSRGIAFTGKSLTELASAVLAYPGAFPAELIAAHIEVYERQLAVLRENVIRSGA
jgi:hypothetical protein